MPTTGNKNANSNTLSIKFKMNETALENYEFKPTDEDNWIMDYSTPCTPPESILSILIMLFACALSRVGLWTFDLAVNQMFQEWVDKDKVARIKTFFSKLISER